MEKAACSRIKSFCQLKYFSVLEMKWEILGARGLQGEFTLVVCHIANLFIFTPKQWKYMVSTLKIGGNKQGLMWQELLKCNRLSDVWNMNLNIFPY